MKVTARQKGQHAEQSACRYLQQHDLVLLQQNFQCRYGEIDLIMCDGDTVVFIEVRARRHQSLVDSLHSVDQIKQNKLIRTAQYFLQITPLLATRPARFDVIAMTTDDGKQHEINWIKNAFQT